MAELIGLLTSWEFAFPIGLAIGGGLLLLLMLRQLHSKRGGLALDVEYWASRVDLRSRRVWVMTLLVLIASVLMTSALSDPRVMAKDRVSIYGKPVMAVVDISGSMDYRMKVRPSTPSGEVQEERSNIEKARAIFADVLSHDLGVDYGLLLYSTEQYVARYFAFKKSLLKDALENDDEIAFISTGTRTAAALALAREFLTKNVPVGDKAILLISDMQGDLDAMLATAEEMENCRYAGIKLFVIVIGPDSPMAINRGTPPPEVEGVMMVDMNDEAGIDKLCQELVAMEDAPVSQQETPVEKDVTPFLAAAALGLVLLCLALSEGRFRRIP